jgi:hypothetical protein
MGTAGALGNLEEPLRPFLGRMLSTDGIRAPVARRPDLEGHYGSVDFPGDWFVGGRCTFLVPGGVPRETQSYRFAGTSEKRRYLFNKNAQGDDYCSSRSSATASQRCTIAKIRFLESPHCRTFRNARATGLLNQTSNLALTHKAKWLRSRVKWAR